jgi:hypothetical protein
MPVVLRSATEADAKHVESLLAELGYPSKEVDVRHRLRRSLHSDTSCFLVAQSASEVAQILPCPMNMPITVRLATKADIKQSLVALRISSPLRTEILKKRKCGSRTRFT